MAQTEKKSAREKLLDISLTMIRQKGYADTTVDQLCAAAGVTKGAFFHHFKSKEELGIAAAQHWTEVTGAMFAAHSYHQFADPFDRIMAYLDLRQDLLFGALEDFTCLVGMMLQETYATSPAIAAASFASITGHAQTLEADFAACIALYGSPESPEAANLALYTQTVLQGAFILSKGAGNAEIAHDSINQLRLYLRLLFNIKGRTKHDGRPES